MITPAGAKRGPPTAPPLLAYEARIVDIVVRPSKEEASAFERESIEAVVAGKKKSFASWTTGLGDEGLAIFNRMPSTAWWVRAYDLEKLLVHWGLRALPGIVACGAGAPSETVPVAAHIDSPQIAPMMAEAYGRLPKQRAQGEKWLFEFPEAAAIGLVPAAAYGRGNAKKFAEGGLARLVDGGRGSVVRDVIARYGLDDALSALFASAEKNGAPARTRPSVDTDAEVRELEAILRRATPNTAAYERLDRLVHVDSDRALFAIAELSKHARSRPLRRAAAKCLAAARVRRSISEEDLALRMIPRLGLDAPEFKVGAASHRFAATTELAPAIVSADGTRATKLPRGAPEALKKRFDLLKKELRTIGTALRSRLELRMISGDTWSKDAFLEHVVGHPVLVEIARGLVFSADGVLFRVTEDTTLASEDDRTIELSANARVTIVHPLDASPETLKQWADRFGDYEILQPFPQLGREHANVVATGNRIPSLEGVSLPSGQLLGLERRGWQRGHIDHGPTLESMQRALPSLFAEVCFQPGIRLDSVDADEPQRILRVDVRGPSGETGEGAPPPSRRALSEIVRDLGLA